MLDCIPEGVTCHENEHYDNVFSNLLSTQFYWHIQDGKRLNARNYVIRKMFLLMMDKLCYGDADMFIA